MRKFYAFLIFTMMTLALHAQVTNVSGKISGAIVDAGNNGIASATVMLLKAADSSLVKMQVSGKSGEYSFDQIMEGRYLISVTAVGHEKMMTDAVELTALSQDVKVKAIQLEPITKAITGVTVVSKKPLIEQKVDRTVVNVDASVTNAGNTALEVLEKSPGVSVDKDGNISLKGKQGVQVYVDGRPTYLSSADLATMLRSMNASQLDQIEIMTNPPAKYDAAGNSGVINIKTKKNKQFGYNGSFTTGYTQGQYARFNESASLNYRNGKFNLFSNLNYNRNHRGEKLYLLRNFRDAGSKEITSVFDQGTSMINEGNYYSAKVGVDYTVSKRTSIGVVANGFYNPSIWRSNSWTNINDPAGDLVTHTKSVTSNQEKWKNYSGNINFRTQLDSAGQELTADIDYIQYRSTSFQPLYSYYFDKLGTPSQAPDTLLGDLPQDITIYSAKMDYTLPLKDGARFEAGFKLSYVKTDNNAVYDNIFNGQAILDSSRSNHFLYKENINAAYVNYSRSLGKKWKTQLGLRLENTNADGVSTGYEYSQSQQKFISTQKEFKRRYTQLFPTAYLQYVASEKNQFVLNYGRRVNRPAYQDLNPFIHFIDRYTFEQGNPNLKPQFSHNFELSHTFNSFLTTTLNYTQTDDIIQQVLEQNDATTETFIKKANIASLRQVGISVSAYKELNKWWSGSIYLNGFNNRFKGIVNGTPISLGMPVFMMQIQQQFKLGKGYTGEVSGFYMTRSVEGVIFIKPMGQIGAGLSKQVLKNKGTLRLNVRDMFAFGTIRGYSKYDVVDVRFRNVNDSRAVTVSFSWRFNKGKEGATGERRRSGADDEKNRVKAGSN